MMDAKQLWETALGQLELQLTKPTFDTWIRNTYGISYEDGVLVVGVHSAYAKDWLENRLYATIQRTVTQIVQRTSSVRFIVRQSSSLEGNSFGLFETQEPNNRRTNWQSSDAMGTRVNPKYTFDTFIVGQSNRLAHAGCQAVAESPGTAYNPLFIYGGVGLGKTHLLHAVGNCAIAQDKQTLYVSAETFANEMINAIKNRTNEEFRAKYRTIDVLLIDDVQFFINKERTQEEFFHTFNDLYQGNRQIVLSSDRPPNAFVGLEERLRSRFEWGLTVDVQTPDLETRMAILAVKSEERGINLSSDVIEFIAQQVQSNIRELEGALNRFLAMARMMEYPLAVETAEKALSAMVRPGAKVTFDDILNLVSQQLDIETKDILGKRRTRNIAMARQIVMYLAREMTEMSLPQIGQELGNRDHTTVMHGCNKIRALFEKDDSIRREILEIKNELIGNGHRVAAMTPQVQKA